MTLEEKTYQSSPVTVKAVKYDGTEACAAAICEKWPDDFVVGTRSKDGSFEGLYLRLAAGDCGAFFVAPGDIVYQNDREKCVFAIPEETFFELFHEVEAR